MITLHRILVPLDGSALAESALPLAMALTQKFDSELILLRVLETPELALVGSYPEDHWSREALQYSHREAQTYLQARQAELMGENIRSRVLVRDNSPAEDILSTVVQENIDLVVISSHGKGSPSPWTSGSVADKVMQYCSCPVLLVRHNPLRTEV